MKESKINDVIWTNGRFRPSRLTEEQELTYIRCENNNWMNNDRSVVLKYLHNSQDNIDEFLREVELLL
ncbi:hypothetical protein RIR_jg15985.t1 [Rhizophagus irregularis DAOM 181602=DAOM 197198]|nr:hypothetical protein RIR_jg15985.t1 [Rhizophagus irregularis DAOM 181602=DAOM 197198]